MAFNFADAIISLHEIGLLDVILPFLLIFTIIFAVLEKTEVLGKTGKTRKFSAVVALAIALLVVVPHIVYPSGDGRDGRLGGDLSGLPDIVEVMGNSLPSVAIWVILFICVLILLSLVAPEWIKDGVLKGNGWTAGILGTLAVLVVFYIFGNSAGFFDDISYGPFAFLADPGNIATILILLVFLGIILYVLWPEKGAAPAGGPEPPKPK